MTTAAVPWVEWFDFCPECRHFREIDMETSLDIASVICVVCAPQFWEGYFHAVSNLPGLDPWDEYKRKLGY